MANRAIVYIDLLGVQNMWQQGGASAVKSRINEFYDFLTSQINSLPHQLHREGEYTAILSGDSTSILCQDYEQAVGIGCHIFTQAFYATNRMDNPFWLRGSIGPWHNQYLTVNTTPIHAKSFQVGTKYLLEDDYLNVVALEKSGFKGMRLTVDLGILQNYGRDFQRSWECFKKPMGFITKLRECTYPHGEHYGDVLWMTENEEQYGHLKGIMASRYKQSTRDQNEFLQASWTRVVFDQVDSIIWTCKKNDPDNDNPNLEKDNTVVD